MHPRQSRKGNLLLSVMGASAQYKRELFRDRQREGIELAANLSKRSIAGEGKSALAREFGVDRHTIYRYEARGTNADKDGAKRRRKRSAFIAVRSTGTMCEGRSSEASASTRSLARAISSPYLQCVAIMAQSSKCMAGWSM